MNTLKKPKRQLNAYNIFFQNERNRLLATLAEPQEGSRGNARRGIGFAELARHVSKEWKKANPETRSYFYKLQHEDGERHKGEMEEYKALLKAQRSHQMQDPTPDTTASALQPTAVLTTHPIPSSIHGPTAPARNATPIETVSHFSQTSQALTQSNPRNSGQERTSNHSVSQCIRHTLYESQPTPFPRNQHTTLGFIHDDLEPLAVFPEHLKSLATLNEDRDDYFSMEAFNQIW
eukprot:scaffold8553_cov111-Amphora_coffeaeformis.AAC.3